MLKNENLPLPTNTREWFLNKNSLIILADIVLFALLYNFLPFERDVVLGLSILTFVAILWLTEAMHVSITALLVPMFAIGFGILTPEKHSVTSQTRSFSSFLVVLLWQPHFTDKS